MPSSWHWTGAGSLDSIFFRIGGTHAPHDDSFGQHLNFDTAAPHAWQRGTWFSGRRQGSPIPNEINNDCAAFRLIWTAVAQYRNWFQKPYSPGCLLVRHDAPGPLLAADALRAFRNVCAISTITHTMALALASEGNGQWRPLYSDFFLFSPGFPICLPQMAPLYTREPPSARNPVRRTIVQLQRPSPQPTLTWNRPEPLLSGHFSDTAPHLCPFFASLRCTRPRVSLPAPAAPRSSAASRRRAAGSDDLPPAGASSIWRASPAGPQFSPAAAGDSSAPSA